MRVIAGIYGGRVLKGPPNGKTRPTSDRLRETLFNILSPRIGPNTRFLDLCSGTGAVGIEALSRGAVFAAFVERARRNCAIIEENLDTLKVPETATSVECIDSEKYLKQEFELPWDIIYFDPPYSNPYAEVLTAIGSKENRILAPDGILIAEHRHKNHLADEISDLRRWRLLRQGETALSFFEFE